MSGAARKRRSTGQRAAAAAAAQRSPGLGERNLVGHLLRDRHFPRLGDNGTESGSNGNGLRVASRSGTSGGKQIITATRIVSFAPVMLNEPSRDSGDGESKLRRSAGVSEAGARCRNPERSEGPLRRRNYSVCHVERAEPRPR